MTEIGRLCVVITKYWPNHFNCMFYFCRLWIIL